MHFPCSIHFLLQKYFLKKPLKLLPHPQSPPVASSALRLVIVDGFTLAPTHLLPQKDHQNPDMGSAQAR